MRRIAEIVGALLLIALAVVCWNLGVTEHAFAAVPDGSPAFVATRYSGSWIATGTASMLVATVMLIDVVRISMLGRSHTG